MMKDPRIYGIRRSLSGIRNTLCVVSGKGGVGKSTISTLMALIAANMGLAVGLLDLDLHGPSCHVILGVGDFWYEEERGIKPYMYEGIGIVSIYPFIGERCAPLRGVALSSAITELLAIINWGRLDILIVDMPPGMGDPLLDIARYVRSLSFLVVTTGSKVSLTTVSRLLRYLIDHRYCVVGLLENMVIGAPRAESIAKHHGVRYVGSIPFDAGLEHAIGCPRKLLETKIAKTLRDLMMADPLSRFFSKPKPI